MVKRANLGLLPEGDKRTNTSKKATKKPAFESAPVRLMGLSLPAEKQAARQLAARLTALAIISVALLFLVWVLISNSIDSNSVSSFPRYQLLLILLESKLFGSMLGVLPLLAAVLVSLIYRNEMVDRIFYVAVSVMVLSVLILLFIGFVQFNDRNITNRYYDSLAVTQEYKDDLKLEIAEKMYPSDPPERFDREFPDILTVDAMRRDHFAERMRAIMATIASAYVAMMAALLGLKGIFERLGDGLLK